MKNRVRLFVLMLLALTIVVYGGDCSQASASVNNITLQDAVNLTLSNNIDLKLLEKQIMARELDLDKADFYSDKLTDANDRIDEGWDEYYTQKVQFEAAKAAGLLTEEQINEIENQLADTEEELRDNSNYRINNLANAQVVELYQTKANLGLRVTKLGVEIAQKQYDLLTRQCYYEVLKDQRLVAAKQAAVKRAESQYKLAADSYQAGMRAKDDMLMAQAQLGLMKADLAKAVNDLTLAEVELKKIMGLSVDTAIKLEDDLTVEDNIISLETGLDQALKNRVEIKKAEMEVQVGQINLSLAKRYTAPNTFAYRQIQLDLDNAQLVLEQQKQTVQAEVYSSYQTVLATKTMKACVEESVKEAEEALDIAAYRYKEGYGISSAVLKSLNMEDAGGTIYEVLAAQEKLSEVQEKVIEITYGYKLAKSKYELDICNRVAYN